MIMVGGNNDKNTLSPLKMSTLVPHIDSNMVNLLKTTALYTPGQDSRLAIPSNQSSQSLILRHRRLPNWMLSVLCHRASSEEAFDLPEVRGRRE